MLDFEVTTIMCVNYLIVVWFSIVIYQVMCMYFCIMLGPNYVLVTIKIHIELTK
jgi:hypothetical protein